MNKTELIDHIAQSSRYFKSHRRDAHSKSVIGRCSKNDAGEGRLRSLLVGFGTFAVGKRTARTGMQSPHRRRRSRSRPPRFPNFGW